MSNLEGLSEPVDTGIAEGSAPTEGGQGETQATPEPSFLDSEQYAGHMVRVRVDGEEVTVPLSEALGGYSRTADYTRKTQALAEQQRQAQFGLTLQQALEANPQETLRLLQSQYAQQAAEQPEEADWTDDPAEGRFRQLDARLSQYEQQQANRELSEAVGILQQRYGADFDAREVVQRAFAQNRMDLEGVYKEIAFDRMRQGQQAADQQRSAEEAKRIAAKTEATSSIHSGNGAANVETPQSTTFTTLEEAWQAAKSQLGITT